MNIRVDITGIEELVNMLQKIRKEVKKVFKKSLLWYEDFRAGSWFDLTSGPTAQCGTLLA